MLPKKFIHPIFRKDRVYPSYLPQTEEILMTLRSMSDVLRKGVGERRKALEQDLSVYHSVLPGKHLHGIIHLLFEQATFETMGDETPESIREKLFDTAAEYWQNMMSCFAERNKTKIINTLGHSVNGKQLANLDEWLYSDVPNNRIMTHFEVISATDILNAYNTAQAQGILAYAQDLKLQIFFDTRDVLKRLFQRLKFFGLLFEVIQVRTDNTVLQINGPNSVLENSRTYGLEFMRFFSVILSLSNWKIEAVVRYKQRLRLYYLELDQTCPCRIGFKQRSTPQAGKNQEFVERWNSKWGDTWQADDTSAILPLPQNRYLIPDICLRATDKDINSYVEIINYNRKGLSNQYESLLEHAPELYFLAIKGKKSHRAEWRKLPEERTIFFVTKLTPSLLRLKFKTLGML